MHRIKWISSSLFFLVLLSGCGNEQGGEVKLNLFAAAGTSSVCEQILDHFNAFPVERNYAASGTLARQIHEGAEAHLYISANRRWMEFLLNHGHLKPETMRVFARNRLVALTSLHNDTGEWSLAYLKASSGVVGDPGYVPVGQYAKQALEYAGFWGELNSSLIRAKDVNTVLRLVEMGEVDWGIAYQSEMKKSGNVKAFFVFPESWHQPIEFYLALTRHAPAEASHLYEQLCAPEVWFYWENGGFDPIPQKSPVTFNPADHAEPAFAFAEQ